MRIITDHHKELLTTIPAVDVVRVAMNERIHSIDLNPIGSNGIVASKDVTGYLKDVLPPIYEACTDQEDLGLHNAIGNATAWFAIHNSFIERGGSGRHDGIVRGQWRPTDGSYDACRAKIDDYDYIAELVADVIYAYDADPDPEPIEERTRDAVDEIIAISTEEQPVVYEEISSEEGVLLTEAESKDEIKAEIKRLLTKCDAIMKQMAEVFDRPLPSEAKHPDRIEANRRAAGLM